VIRGAEWNYIADETSISTPFTVTTQSNRMGYRLKGNSIAATKACDIISSPVTQGTVQLTSSGELIVLMADAQTAGGYPRILQVIEADLPALAQKKPGDAIQFEIVSLQEAEALLLHQSKELQNLLQTIQQLDAY
jgi:antagonist of KipI